MNMFCNTVNNVRTIFEISLGAISLNDFGKKEGRKIIPI